MKRNLIRAAALASFAWFVWTIAARGWESPSTDFPNYYTAAVLARTHQPLHRYYEWTWFQRQMHLAGFDHQLGGYIPQTPLTMIPFLPLSFVTPVAARKLWFLLNLVFLTVTLGLLTRMTKFRLPELWLLAFLACGSLRSNFELGQYYLFLLALLTLASYLVLQGREEAGGALFGAATALKLYGAPLLLFALCIGRWRIVRGILAALLLSLLCAAWVFGWHDLSYFASGVLPRALAGEILDPWHFSNGTVATLLRRLFLAEAELHPRPLFDSPAAFRFLFTLFPLTVLALPAIAGLLRPTVVSGRVLAWWIIAILLASPNTASYTWVLLILPIALLLDGAPPKCRVLLLFVYVLCGLPLWPAWSWAFPKVWLLMFLFIAAGYRELRRIPLRPALFCAAAFVTVSAAAAWLEPVPRQFRRAVTEPGAIYSSSPALSRAGLLYESIGKEAYVLRRQGRTYSFDGDAFHPATPDTGWPVYFELARARHSAIMRLEENEPDAKEVPLGLPDPREPAVSHDGTMLAFISRDALFFFDGRVARKLAAGARDPAFAPDDRSIVFAADEARSSIRVADLQSGAVTTLLEDSHDLATPSLLGDKLLYAARRGITWQVWLRNLSTGREVQLTTGHCNHTAPVFNSSSEIVFAGDCGRGLGLPALFRAPLQ